MWLATLGRRDFLETVASGPSSEVCGAAREVDLSSALIGEPSKILVGWSHRPSVRLSFPILAIINGDQIRDVLAAVNSSTKAMSPLSAFCRVLTVEQAEGSMKRNVSALTAILANAVAMLSLAEVQLHSAGQLKGRQVGPAACRRTLSFAWAKALKAGMPSAETNQLARRWLDAYEICNMGSADDDKVLPVHHVIPVLQAAGSLLSTGPGDSPILRLIDAILIPDPVATDVAWQELSHNLPVALTLRDLEKAPREERGSYLQRSFGASARSSSFPERDAAQGFLATQIAPSSLEHLDLLMERSGPGAALWYVLFAALQNPVAVMNAYGGLGRRVSRDIRSDETLDTAPRADIALDELKILTRYGTEDLSRMAGHSNEIEVELLPLVSGTFRLVRNQASRQQFVERSTVRASDQQVVSNLRHISHLLSRTISELSEPQDNPRTRSTRRKPTL